MQMIEYKEMRPSSTKLKPYVCDYLFVTWEEKAMKSKDILPRPGASLIFTNQHVWMDDKMLAKQILMGVHNTVFTFKWQANEGVAFIVRFTPYGLSRFLEIPLHKITNKAIDCSELWGDAISKLHDSLMVTYNTSEQVRLIEDFLSQRFIAPTGFDNFIFQLADTILNENETPSISVLRKRIPLSVRQLERRFKDLIGVSIQTYIRLCRFNNAKEMLVKKKDLNLTDIGYTSGYFDQAHFSNEFKVLSKLRPKDFLHFSPFYKNLSELKNK